MSDTLETIHEAANAQLECIAHEVRENGGKFTSPQMLDDAKDCLQVLKDLRKLAMLPAK